jgi:hypothetical protein
MSTDTNGEWDGLAPTADFAAWYRKSHAPADALTAPLPVPDETVAWTPPWDDTPPKGRHAGPVQCNCQTAGCPDAPRVSSPGDPRLLLSCAPGVATRMSKERVRNGEWEDVATYGRDARVRVHKPAVDELAGITLGLEEGVHDLGALIDRSATLHSDADLRGDLVRLAAELDGQLRTDAAYPVPVPEYAPEGVAA